MNKLNNLLSLNERNLEFVFNYNERKYFPQVDDKIKCKEQLDSNKVAISETLAVCESFASLDTVLADISQMDNFVIKPSKGRGGGGILLCGDRTENGWVTPSGRLIHIKDIEIHLSNILFGVYSLGGNDDRALIERKIIPHTFFTDIYPAGVADIRVIIFKSNVIMAMTRIPTSKSNGKANLHQGAIGVGVDIKTGELKQAAHKGRLLSKHPDTNILLAGKYIPDWQNVLETARQAADSVDLLYLGVDLVLDINKGPLVLELNARPGLEIQVANQEGLKSILEQYI